MTSKHAGKQCPHFDLDSTRNKLECWEHDSVTGLHFDPIWGVYWQTRQEHEEA